jgi:hypothetical protein
MPVLLLKTDLNDLLIANAFSLILADSSDPTILTVHPGQMP